MANNDLGIRFTNVIYATKNDVIRTMKISIVDNIWKQILEYRSNFNCVLSLEHIDGSHYSTCLAPMIIEKVTSLERKMTRSMVNLSKLSREGKRKFFNESYFKILKDISLKYKLEIEDSKIRNIIANESSVVSPNEIFLMHYLNVLKDIEQNYTQSIDEDLLGKIYSMLLGTEDLMEFYRTKELDNSFTKVLVNKMYLGIPTNNIENAMNSLFTFVNNSTLSPLVKAVCALYFCYYVKPFETYSEEIGVLLFKYILAYNDLEGVAATFDLEGLLNHTDELERVLLESQKTYDLTYIINFVSTYLDSKVSDVLDDIVLIKKDDIVRETYSTIVENVPNIPENSDDNIEQTPKVEENRESPSQLNNNDALIYNKNIAITSLPEGLSEDEARKLENHLKELYPSLSNGQAYFYARHCTIGMKYTISQYKKCLNCAYETARTSMDGLVYLGFYSKEPLKNKYIYTPVKKK